MTDWIIMLNDKIIRKFSLEDGDKLSIGRGKEADIVIDNTAISRKHISIESTSGIFLVSDLGSTNGTFVNNKKITENEPVSDSDQIKFGKFHLQSASSTDSNARIADSISAIQMDLDEETVFVTSGHSASPQNSADFAPDEMQTKLTVISGNASPRLVGITGKNSVKVGKDKSCDIIVPGFFVAKAQFYIFKRNSKYILVPQNSWAGTFVNDFKISDEVTLHKGDIIRIRHTSIRFDS